MKHHDDVCCSLLPFPHPLSLSCCPHVQEMLDMLRDHQNNCHSVRLEWTVIWLIVIEVVVGVLEVLGMFGMVGNEGKPPPAA